MIRSSPLSVAFLHAFHQEPHAVSVLMAESINNHNFCFIELVVFSFGCKVSKKVLNGQQSFQPFCLDCVALLVVHNSPLWSIPL